MNSMTSSSLDLQLAGARASSEVSAFHWLLILGFPPTVAAATAMPELFTSETAPRAAR
jgi:hypothetical protein